MAAFDSVANAEARTSLAWSRTGWSFLTMAGMSVLAGAHRDDLAFGLLEAVWLALAASVLTYRQRKRTSNAPGQIDRTQIALAATGTTVAAGLTLLPLMGG